jgi:hypothetical protein
MRGDEGGGFGAGVDLLAGSAKSRGVRERSGRGQRAFRKLGCLLVEQGERCVGVARRQRCLGGVKQSLLFFVGRGGCRGCWRAWSCC